MDGSLIGWVAGAIVGSVFLVAAVAKLSRPLEWRVDAAALGVGRRLAAGVPILELVLGALLVVGLAGRLVPLAAAGVLMVFTVRIARFVGRDDAPACSCFGRRSGRAVGARDLARNAVLIALAIVAVAFA